MSNIAPVSPGSRGTTAGIVVVMPAFFALVSVCVVHHKQINKPSLTTPSSHRGQNNVLGHHRIGPGPGHCGCDCLCRCQIQSRSQLHHLTRPEEEQFYRQCDQQDFLNRHCMNKNGCLLNYYDGTLQSCMAYNSKECFLLAFSNQ